MILKSWISGHSPLQQTPCSSARRAAKGTRTRTRHGRSRRCCRCSRCAYRMHAQRSQGRSRIITTAIASALCSSAGGRSCLDDPRAAPIARSPMRVNVPAPETRTFESWLSHCSQMSHGLWGARENRRSAAKAALGYNRRGRSRIVAQTDVGPPIGQPMQVLDFVRRTEQGQSGKCAARRLPI